jgi:hypothetical protein
MTKSKDKLKKERILHTRISEALDRELRDKASLLGVSVSKLVRNTLTNTLDLVENIVADSAKFASNSGIGNLFQGVKEGPEPIAEETSSMEIPSAWGDDPSLEVLAWQEMLLNLNAICATCNTILPRGSRAALGLPKASSPPPVICLTCLDNQYSSPETPAPQKEKPTPDPKNQS